jgi:hypothetical protein
MRNVDLERFGIILTMVHEYYDKTISKGVAAMWWEGLECESIDDIEISFKHHMRNNGTFCPKISDIIKIINGDPRDNAVIQWGHVMAQSKHASNGMSFRDPITARVVKAMGGKELGMYGASDWAHSRNYFIDSYIAYQNQMEVDKAVERQKLINQTQRKGISNERSARQSS